MKLLNPLPQRLDTGATATFAGLLAADGTAAAPSIAFASDTNTGFYHGAAADEINVSNAGVKSLQFLSDGRIYGAQGNNYLQMSGAGLISLTASGTNQNITLTPSGTGFVALGTSLLKGAVFASTYVSLTSFVVLAANDHIVFAVNGAAECARFHQTGRLGLGTGATDSGALLQIGTNTTTSAGGIVFGTDTFLYRSQAQTLAIQGSGQPGLFFYRASTLSCFIDSTATQVRLGSQEAAQSTLIYSGNAIALTLDSSQNAAFAGAVGLPATGNLYWSARASLKSPANGIVTLYNDAGTDFNRLQFGGTTASFPSIKRSSASLEFRVADDSAYAGVIGLTASFTSMVTRSAALTAGVGEVAYGGTTATTVGAAGGASALPATPSGYIIVNVAGTQMKVPYYAN